LEAEIQTDKSKAEESNAAFGRWQKPAIFSLADQAVFSGSMLVLNILLARWTSPEEYGAFAVIFALFLILAGIHNGLIVEPMTVFGAQQEPERLPRFLGQVYILHAVVVLGVALVAAIIVLFITAESLSDSKWALVITTPLILCFWTARRAFYISGEPENAFAISSIYALAVVSGLIALKLADVLSGFSAFLLFGISGFAISIFPIGRLFRSIDFPSLKSIKESLGKHWIYGKWALGESLMFAFGTSIYPLLIAYFGGVTQAGQFRVVQIVFLPLTHVLIALSLILLPWLTRSRMAADSHKFSHRAYLIVGLFFGISLCYVLPILGFGEEIVTILYGNQEYQELSWLIPYLGLTALLSAISTACMIVLRSAEKPKLVFLSTTVSMGVTLGIGVPLVAMYGSIGLAGALVLSTAAGTVLLIWAMRFLIQKTNSTVLRYPLSGELPNV